VRLGRRRLLSCALLSALPTAVRAQPGMVFPRDFGSHPGSGLEWWYLTGILDGADGRPRYGYQLTFFRLKGPAAADHPSRFAARQLLLAHAALSDLAGSRLLHEQRVARAGFGLAEASEADTAVHVRDWSLQRHDDGGYEARFSSPKFALSLQLRAAQPPLLQGERGWSRKGPTQYSHYYSEPQLRTEARVALDGHSETLQGRSWLDHEWSDEFLGEQAVGWDWAGINLDDGGALTVFRLRRADGSVHWAGGSWRRPDGRTDNFAPEQLTMTPTRRWHSPASGADYPLDWTLQTPLGTLRLRALMDAQEVDARASTGFRYWEGAAEVLAADGRRLGAGYLELTGYAGRMAGLR